MCGDVEVLELVRDLLKDSRKTVVTDVHVVQTCYMGKTTAPHISLPGTLQQGNACTWLNPNDKPLGVTMIHYKYDETGSIIKE